MRTDTVVDWEAVSLTALPDGMYIHTATRDLPLRTFTAETFDEGIRNALASPYAIPGYGR